MKAFALVMVPFLAIAGIALKCAEFILDLCRDALWLFTHRICKHL